MRCRPVRHSPLTRSGRNIPGAVEATAFERRIAGAPTEGARSAWFF
jgi:hypothetical protein